MVLKNFTLDVQPGETIALLGATGSGKSTLINLIPRFYDPVSGKITVDEVDIRDVTLESLRKQISIVLQETYLFAASLKDNIAYGNTDATMEQIIAVAKAANIHDFIASLPKGYDTEIGERGVTLSGGDPVLQRDFSLALLRRCRENSIHTAIETAANCRWDDLALLLSVSDLAMVDIKHMDSRKHREMTGVSNKRILANAQKLIQTDKPVIFRIPVVPTVNNTPEEIGAIAAFVRHLVDLRLESSDGMSHCADSLFLELLPFHRLAADKYRIFQ